MMTSVESPEGQLPPRAGLSLGCTSSIIQAQDYDFGKLKIFRFTLAYLRHVCLAKLCTNAASYTFDSSVDVMEIVTKLRLP